MTGRMLSEAWGRVAFGIFFVGFNLTFFPQHILGLKGMPRRVYTYQPELGWGTLNLVVTAGAFVMALGLLVYLANVVISLRRGAIAPANPWQAPTLEWAQASPPPPYNFLPSPTVSGRNPLWDEPETQPAVVGIRADARYVLVTRVMDAEPDHVEEMPGPSVWPFVTAVAVSALFIGSIFTPWAVVWGSLPVFIGMVCWFWPRKGKPPSEFETDRAEGRLVPQEQTR
jgi:cytochrome c oxidase subunit 1